MTAPLDTVGILYPGEMGVALGSLLQRRGARVVTTSHGRSAATERRCRAARLCMLDSLEEVVRQSDIVISLVPPAAAGEVAEQWRCLAHLSPPGALYVDANSIGPELARRLGDAIAQSGRGFLDASINGLAANLAISGTLFVSGEQSQRLATLIGDAMRVRVLGNEPGLASAMKMLLSGLSKGICALFFETALAARRQGMLGEMTEEYARLYPGVMALVERMLPTYPRHAKRRADESREMERMVLDLGLEPVLLAAVRGLHERVAEENFPDTDAPANWSVESLIEWLDRRKFLEPMPVAVDTNGMGMADAARGIETRDTVSRPYRS